MDFLTFMDEFFKRDWNDPYKKILEFISTKHNWISVQIEGNYFQIEIEKIGSDSFRLDIPYKKETMDDFERFIGTYDYIKSIIDDIITMEDSIYKLAYGRSKPILEFLDRDYSGIYKDLMSGEE